MTSLGASGPAEASSPSDRRLLVVDDEMSLRIALERYFRAKSFQVTAVESANAALDAMKVDKFAAALVDVRMPGMSGLELVSRALAIDPDLAIVMLSGVPDAQSARDAIAHGAVDYLVKPVQLSALLEVVEDALRKRGSLPPQKRF